MVRNQRVHFKVNGERSVLQIIIRSVFCAWLVEEDGDLVSVKFYIN